MARKRKENSLGFTTNKLIYIKDTLIKSNNFQITVFNIIKKVLWLSHMENMKEVFLMGKNMDMEFILSIRSLGMKVNTVMVKNGEKGK